MGEVGSRTVGVLLIVGACVLGGCPGRAHADCAPTPSGTPRFTSVEVARIPVGKSPNDLSDEEVGCCGENEDLGCAFLGPDGSAYVYDTGNENLKILQPTVGERFKLKVLPGIASLEVRQGLVYDGAVDEQGTLYLLVDTGRPTQGYRLFWRTQSDSTWQLADPLAVEGGVPVGGGRIRARPDGDVVVYFADERTSQSFIVARNGRVLPSTERETLRAGIPLPGHRLATLQPGGMAIEGQGTPILFRNRGEYLGWDDAGNHYFIESCPGPPFVLRRYDEAGSLSASVRLPQRTDGWKLMTGKFDFQVTRNGDVLQFWSTRKALQVIRWRAVSGH